MIGNVLALISAVCFGATHFINGLVSRRANGVAVALFAQLGGTALAVLLALGLPEGPTTVPGLCWGALSGLGTGVGVAFLYQAMAKGALSVVVPVSDVGAVVLPVLVGLVFLGERPSVLALIGIIAGVPAIWLVSQRGDGREDHASGRYFSLGVPHALVASVGFALQFIGMARIPADNDLWPVVASRVVSVVVIVVLLVRTGEPWRLPGRLATPAIAAGVVGTAAIIFYLFATRQQLMAIATVLSALYPAIPVLLAFIVLRERIGRWQVVGLLCAATSIVLVALR